MSLIGGSTYICAYKTDNCLQYNTNGTCIQCVGQF